MDPARHQRRSGIARLILGTVLVCLGVFILPLAATFWIFLTSSEPTQFLVPGSHVLQVDDPGRYYVWHDYETVHQGSVYRTSRSLPHGLRVAVRDAAGSNLRLTPDASITASNGSTSRGSIGYVEVAQPGSLTIDVTGNTQPLVFSFGPSNLLLILTTACMGVVICFALTIAGIVIGILGIVRITQSPRAESQP